MRRPSDDDAIAFGYLLAMAYGASFVTHRLVSAATGAG